MLRGECAYARELWLSECCLNTEKQALLIKWSIIENIIYRHGDIVSTTYRIKKYTNHHNTIIMGDISVIIPIYHPAPDCTWVFLPPSIHLSSYFHPYSRFFLSFSYSLTLCVCVYFCIFTLKSNVCNITRRAVGSKDCVISLVAKLPQNHPKIICAKIVPFLFFYKSYIKILYFFSGVKHSTWCFFYHCSSVLCYFI